MASPETPIVEFAGWIFTPRPDQVGLPLDKRQGDFDFIFQNKSAFDTGAGPFSDPNGGGPAETRGLRVRVTYNHSSVR
jgi:hypothetical protein